MAAEQTYVTGLHRRLDEVRARTVSRLEEALATVPHNPQAVGEREAQVELHSQRLVALDAAESGLCFGRLDRRDADVPRYVGRIGLSAEDGAEEPLLVDWRPPAAQPFYTATPLHDLGVRRRRHIRTRGRTVVSIADETLDLDDPDVAERSGLVGESVLLAALNATRTGRMTDIVRTIQAEQDRIIRADSRGVLVVQGGPGTGKTAVALHRAAYLLYTHREPLASSRLLVVGPSRSFLQYIEQVLPSLGETGVVLSSVGQLYPGIDTQAEDPPATAALKGSLRMADLLKRAVQARQVAPASVQTIEINGEQLEVHPELIARAIRRAQETRKPHNEARVTFVSHALSALTAQLATQLREGGDTVEDDDLRMLREDLRSSQEVRVLLNTAWLPLSPEKLLGDLYSRPSWLATLTPSWPAERRALLARPRQAPFTVADVPLLDEAAELL